MTKIKDDVLPFNEDLEMNELEEQENGECPNGGPKKPKGSKGVNVKELTLIQLMERIVEQASHSDLSAGFFAKVSAFSEELASRLNMTSLQAVLLSLVVEYHNDEWFQVSDLQRHTRAPYTRVMQYISDVEDLCKKGYFAAVGERRGFPLYELVEDAMKAIVMNEVYVAAGFSNLSISDFLSRLDYLVDSIMESHGRDVHFIDKLEKLVNDNLHLKLCKELKNLKAELSGLEWVTMAILCVEELLHDQNFAVSSLTHFMQHCDIVKITRAVEDGEFKPMQMGLVKSDAEELGCVRLSRKVMSLLLSEYGKKARAKSKSKSKSKSQRRSSSEGKFGLKSPSSIIKKELYYPETVKVAVDKLFALVDEKGYKGVVKNLKANEMRPGFTCLFYGAAGTGKTETVLQLAKKSGRSIMQVDMSQVNDKFVGESEKNVKAIFDRYKDAMKAERKCPILLLNEADAIIGKRLHNVDHSVDATYNTMQNILLQEMETFEGILIATTNLQDNMDDAFERRFLYKVRFEKPTAEVRKRIWMSAVKGLTETMADTLAAEYEFSGGQIDNVARKYVVERVLSGEPEDVMALLKGFCDDEKLAKECVTRTLGFRSMAS